jgi:hypothetical protein
MVIWNCSDGDLELNPSHPQIQSTKPEDQIAVKSTLNPWLPVPWICSFQYPGSVGSVVGSPDSPTRSSFRSPVEQRDRYGNHINGTFARLTTKIFCWAGSSVCQGTGFTVTVNNRGNENEHPLLLDFSYEHDFIYCYGYLLWRRYRFPFHTPESLFSLFWYKYLKVKE